MTIVSWAEVLANLELLSHGSTVNWSPTGRSRSSEHGFPQGELRPPHEYWRERYDRASEENRPAIVKAALEDLESWRRRALDVVIHEETEQELDARIQAKADQKWTADEIALSFKLTKTRVRRALAAAVEREPTADEQKARELLAQGHLSDRQIAFITKVPRTTVQRLRRKAA